MKPGFAAFAAAPGAARAVAISFLLLTGSAGRAAGLEQLHDFLSRSVSARGAFEQASPGPNHATVHVRGHFEFQRPGRFRWAIESPYAQLIVSDGDWLMVHDPDLKQVTRRHLAGALPASPASILFGSNRFEKDFRVSDDGESGGVQWVLALPEAPDAPFPRVRIGFRDSLPAAMELRDSFGQDTRLTFTRVERNPAIEAAHFRFTPPPGTEVLEAQ